MNAQTVLTMPFTRFPKRPSSRSFGASHPEPDASHGENLVRILPAWLPPFSHRVHTPPSVVEIRFLFAVLGPPAKPMSRERIRGARKRHVRASTLNLERVTKQKLAQWRADEPDDGRRRLPLTRSECIDEERPCRYISCKWHMFLDVNQNKGSLKFNFPDLFEPDGTPRLEGMLETCALDVADRGGVTLEALAERMNMTRERIRQIEKDIIKKLRGTPMFVEVAKLFGLRLDRGDDVDITDETIDSFGEAGKAHVDEDDGDELRTEDEL